MNPTTKHKLARWLARLGQVASGTLFPPRCLGCAGFLEWERALAQLEQDPGNITTEAMLWFCASCIVTVVPCESVLACPMCAVLPEPFLDEKPQPGLCASCLSVPPPWARVVAVFEHTGAARRALHRLKFELAQPVGLGLAALLADRLERDGLVGQCDVLVPVPLSAESLSTRGFNQAELLADGVGKRIGSVVHAQALRQVRASSQAQHRLSRAERAESRFEAFEVCEGVDLKGYNVVLVDDVMTTGATARAAVDALKSAGAGNCIVAVLNRA